MPFTQAEPAAVLPAGPISPRSGVPSRVVHGLMAPMRDGAMLATDLIRPDAPGPGDQGAGSDHGAPDHGTPDHGTADHGTPDHGKFNVNRMCCCFY